jgi:uncharacterized membrane protein
LFSVLSLSHLSRWRWSRVFALHIPMRRRSICFSYLLTEKPSKTSVVVIHFVFSSTNDCIDIILFFTIFFFFVFNMYLSNDRNKRILVLLLLLLLLLLLPSCMLLFRPWIRKEKQWNDWKQKHHVLMH